MERIDYSKLGKVGVVLQTVETVLTDTIDQISREVPGTELVLVLRLPSGGPEGGVAVLCGEKPKPEKASTLESVMMQMERAHRLLRDGAERTGRQLWRSPDEPEALAVEAHQIVNNSRELARALENEGKAEVRNITPSGKVCKCARCRVGSAAMLIASGIRMLHTVGVAEEQLRDMSRLCKETCRRAHLRVLEMSTRAQA